MLDKIKKTDFRLTEDLEKRTLEKSKEVWLPPAGNMCIDIEWQSHFAGAGSQIGGSVLRIEIQCFNFTPSQNRGT
jgi:hypothetical protein